MTTYTVISAVPCAGGGHTLVELSDGRRTIKIGIQVDELPKLSDRRDDRVRLCEKILEGARGASVTDLAGLRTFLSGNSFEI